MACVEFINAIEQQLTTFSRIVNDLLAVQQYQTREHAKARKDLAIYLNEFKSGLQDVQAFFDGDDAQHCNKKAKLGEGLNGEEVDDEFGLEADSDVGE